MKAALIGIFLICVFFITPANAGLIANTSVSSDIITLEKDKGELIKLDSTASSIFLANPEIADFQIKLPGLIYLFAKKPGETTLYAADKKGNPLLKKRIIVIRNLADLRNKARIVAPNGNFSIHAVGDAILLKGTISSAEEAANLQHLVSQYVATPIQILNQLKVTSPAQVNIRVRVVEMSREIKRALGVNWSVSYEGGNGDVTFGLNKSVATAGQDGFNINGAIDALDTNGLVTVLSEPNLTALSGEEASFHAGGEFPIIVPQGNDKIVIEYREYGVRLDFRPTILSSNLINLRVEPEVSQLDATGAVEISGYSIPALKTRRASTTVELTSGQSFAIAGLLQNNTNNTDTNVTWLGNLPLVGALFRSRNYQRSETELVIIVTPYIVNSVNSENLTTPLSGMDTQTRYKTSTTNSAIPNNIGYLL